MTSLSHTHTHTQENFQVCILSFPSRTCVDLLFISVHAANRFLDVICNKCSPTVLFKQLAGSVQRFFLNNYPKQCALCFLKLFKQNFLKCGRSNFVDFCQFVIWELVFAASESLIFYLEISDCIFIWHQIERVYIVSWISNLQVWLVWQLIFTKTVHCLVDSFFFYSPLISSPNATNVHPNWTQRAI